MYKKINIECNSDDEFDQAMYGLANDIHSNTLYAIDEAFNTNEEDAIIAYINTDGLLSIPKDLWVENLENTLDYFISTEEYEKCSEVKQLLTKICK